MKILNEEELQRLTTARLLSIRRVLTPTLARLAAREDDGDIVYKLERQELAELREYDERLRRVMATREHVNRKL